MQKGTRVWIIADRAEDARRLARIFSDLEAFSVTGSVVSGGTEDIFPNAADLILIRSDDPAVARMASATRPGIPVLQVDPPPAGARPATPMRGLLPDTATPTEIRAAATALAAGLEVATPEPPDAGLQSEFSWLEPLTERELEILNLLAEGLSNPAIAKQLRVSRNTVKFHVSSIIQKLGAASRTEAVTLALKRGLIII
jgi:DNA-binding CsgD family transcriptional regulator